ncbi:trehalose-phosphatase [Sphingomonas japonica]|uniref:Trehalose 6-phosphate phosphatase n=1 Tax=Sphingomonas japonica TaxID=511662 RepID=A0ABX0TVY0_9SPHN|nr:trehalose-phosphatase [Sphingomonas japonica]NIJ22484.1 trehalose 6-phosphate phosphatase [Sphingomonas japonica]
MIDIDASDRPLPEKSARLRPPTDLLRGATLFLDFDGTLVEIADRPDDVAIPPGLRDLLARLASALDGRLALVSGRSVDTLARLLPDHGVVVSGSHGLEFARADGSVEQPDPPEALQRVRARFEEFAEGRDGILVESKPLGIGLHYREAPHLAKQAEALAVAVAQAHGLPLQRGKMVFEVRAAGGHKGSAIETLMGEMPFSDGCPIFLGDDVTDEDGFEAVSAMGGDGILIGPDRDSAAVYRLDGVAEALAWLEAACPAAR